MTTREFYDGVVEDVLAELGFPTDDEGAMAAFAAELGKRHADFATELDEYVCAEARRRIAPIAMRLMEAGEEHARVWAYVSYQVWRNDYAEDFGEARFDARRALDGLPLALVESLEAGVAGDGTDEVFFEAASLGLCEPHDGPFSCYIEDAEELAAYVAARRAREAR